MSEPIKSRIDFDSPQPVHHEEKYQQKQNFMPSDEETFQSVENLNGSSSEAAAEQRLQSVFNPPRSLWYWMVAIGGMGLVISLLAQGTVWIYHAWKEQQWIELGSVMAGGLMVLAGVGALLSEWQRLWRLHQRAEVRDIARDLLNSHSLGQGKPFCLTLIQQAKLSQNHPAVQRWQASLHDTHSDREIVTLYSKQVQPVIDKQAQSEISRYVLEATLMIAISPLALVDMAFIAWRNLRLINRIATLYGIELGYFSRIRLFRLVLLNMTFAGGSELVREVGMDWLSQDLAARLSVRAAQGIGAGLLTARLGIKAMELCRPLPWLADDKPRLSDFRRELITQLKKSLLKNKAHQTDQPS